MKRVFSRGRGTKAWGPSSMTQFKDILVSRWRTSVEDFGRYLSCLGAGLAGKKLGIFRQYGHTRKVAA